MASGDLVQVTADGRGVSGAADRQNILQQIRCHAVGHQRGPAGLQVKQFRGHALGQEQVQRAEGPGRPGLAAAAVKARTGQRDGTKGGAELDLARSLAQQGATDVFAYCTHGVLSGGAATRVAKSELSELVVTDSICTGEADAKGGKIRRLTIAPLLAEAIRRIADESSVSSLFD